MHLDIKKKKNLKKEKEKKRRKAYWISKRTSGALNKFVINNKQNIEDNLGEKLVNEQEIHQKELEDNKNTIDVLKKKKKPSIVTNIYDSGH
jgi:hypothetical protein